MRIVKWVPLSVAALVIAGLCLTNQSGAQQQPDPARQVVLETIGALGAAHLHQTYLNIGFIADGKAEGTYTAKDAKDILQTVLALQTTVDKQFEKFGKLTLDADDRKALSLLRNISAILAKQGKELQAFWDTDNEERGAAYEKLRRQAWEEIQKLAIASVEEK